MSTDEEADGKAIPALIFAEQIDGGFGVEAQSGFAEGEKGNKTENMSPKSGTLIVGWIRTHIDVQSDIIQCSGHRNIGYKTVVLINIIPSIFLLSLIILVSSYS